MFTLPANIITAARQAAALMCGDTALLPDCNGRTLVRYGTPEAADRLADSSVLILPINIDRIPYLLCSR